MMIALLIGGACAILAGLLAIVYGLQLELSFGNTLIQAGAFGVCSGIIVLGQVLIVRELRNIARRLGARAAEARPHPALGAAAELPAEVGSPFPGAPVEAQSIPAAASSPPWREEAAARDRTRQEPSLPPHIPDLEQVEPAAPPPPPRRRNLLFSSSVRKDRERAGQPEGEAAAQDHTGAQSPELTPAAPPTFEDAWPKSERGRSAEGATQRRAVRPPSAFSGTSTGAPADRPTPPPRSDGRPVTVIKSGVVDGMAYSLYSDGSIEAQMPEGMMRFASIDELRAHLDQRS